MVLGGLRFESAETREIVRHGAEAITCQYKGGSSRYTTWIVGGVRRAQFVRAVIQALSDKACLFPLANRIAGE
jgi:hypothetical protein